MKRVALIAMADFENLPMGGEVRLLNNLLRQKMPEDIEFSLLGMSFSSDDNVGEWKKKKLGDQVYNFFPLCQVLKEKEKTHIPFRLRMSMGLRKYAKKAGIESFDVVYVHAAELISPISKLKVPIVYHVHGDPSQTLRISRFPLFRLKVFSDYYNHMIVSNMKRADGILWAADTSRRLFLSKYPVAEEIIRNKSVVIHSSFDTNLIPGEVPVKFDENKRYLITVGRLSRVKRIDFIIKSFAGLCQNENGEPLELIICGNGEEEDKLKALSDKLGVKEKIHFAGNVNREQLAAYLSKASVFLFASENEAMSLVVLESLYMGVPVVSSDVGDLYLAIEDGKTGFIVKDFTKKAYIDAIQKALKLPEEETSQKCREAAMQFGPEKMRDKICDYMREFC